MLNLWPPVPTTAADAEAVLLWNVELESVDLAIDLNDELPLSPLGTTGFPGTLVSYTN